MRANLNELDVGFAPFDSKKLTITHQGVLDEEVHFIQKPFSHSALAAKVRKVLDNKAKEDMS